MGSVTYFMHARGGDSDWVSRLHKLHGAQLQQFLTRMLGDRQAAEELAQETYLKLYRLCRPEEVTCPRALLFDAATRLAISYLRRKRAEQALAVVESEDESIEVPDDLARPDRRAAVEQAMQWLTEIVEHLPPNLKSVFLLRYVRQLGRQEIADQLKISVNAVEQRLTRALAHCRARLSALGLDWPTLD